MKASDLAAKNAAIITPPPRVFVLQPSAFTDRWTGRPTKPIGVGLIRVSAEDRVRCDAEAVLHADKRLPPERRKVSDPVWQRCYELAFVHHLIGRSITNPADAMKPLWPAQDGSTMLMEVDALGLDPCPIASARFTDEGIARIFDEMDILSRTDPVGRRMALDEELLRLGRVLADGSFFARLTAANTAEAVAVGQHIRMLAGGILDLMEHGREVPLPLVKHG